VKLPCLILAALTLVGCAGSQSAMQTPKAPAPDRPASVPILLGLDPVRAELKLSSLQCALLDSLRSEYKSRSRQITAIGMADQDAALRANWDLRTLRDTYNKRAVAVLSNSQQERLRQIERQMLGGSLLTSPSEQQLLGLGPQQQRKLALLEKQDQANAAAINARYNRGTISSFWKDIYLHNNQRQTSKKMLAVLTQKQKEHWLVLSGQKMGLPKVHDPNASSKSLFEGY